MISGLLDSLKDEDVQAPLNFLEEIGFQYLYERLVDRHTDLLEVYSVVAAFLDMTVVSYCCAHLEKFDLKHFDRNLGIIKVGDYFALRRRSLQCLDGYFHNEQVWVFEELHPENIGHTEHLCLLTTPELFAGTWDPIWCVRDQDDSKFTGTGVSDERRILRYNVGTGWIIPWPKTPDDPEPLEGEVFAHWTEDIADLMRHGESFPDASSGQKLIIGAGDVMSTFRQCESTPDTITFSFLKQKALVDVGTKPDHIEAEMQFAFALTPPFAQIGVQRTFRKRTGATLKDAIVSSWINEPNRSAWMVENWYGIEISGCTQNARRIKLARLIGSVEMENYFNCISFPWSEGCKTAYFQALRSPENGSFHKLYTEHVTWRNEIVNAVGQSLRALKTT